LRRSSTATAKWHAFVQHQKKNRIDVSKYFISLIWGPIILFLLLPRNQITIMDDSNVHIRHILLISSVDQLLLDTWMRCNLTIGRDSRTFQGDRSYNRMLISPMLS
jgi:hypothetical protein